jgi:predicted acylesterase/phospholipase RssA
VTNQPPIWKSVPTVPVYLYALRIQIIGFLLLWPFAGWAFRSPLLRGLQDIGNRQVGTVSQLAAAQAVFLAVTTNLVLLWIDARLNGERGQVKHTPERLLGVRRVVSTVSLLFWYLFMADVRSGSEASYFWTSATANLAAVLFGVVAIEEFMNGGGHPKVKYRLFPLPLPWVWGDSFHLRRVFFRAPATGLSGRFPRQLSKETRLKLSRIRATFMRGADWLLGPGFLDYRGQRARLLPGHFTAFLWLLFIFGIFEDSGLQFRNSASTIFGLRAIAPSSLSMALTAGLFLISLLSFMAFYADRFRLPLSLLFLMLIAFSTSFSGVDHLFWSEPVQPAVLDEALTPRQAIGISPRKVIVVAAAGGGIQASGWTAQVLSGLREGEHGPAFKRALRVISGVSGGAVGAAFYAGTYDGVWGSKAYSPEEARNRAMASSLNAVLWGLVYPDLHRLLLPVPRWLWQDEDRGSSLERSIATTAGRSPGPKLLSLAPLVKDGFPVLLLNATLSAEALPVTFTNSRYPGPQTVGAGLRGIRSFHEDFRLETRLETAVRLSASFPIVSPAARPSELHGIDTFVDGGYFDNSGLYTLMGWLSEAAAGLPAAERREVLLLLIDAFPEPTPFDRGRVDIPWYRQLTIPFETVIGVRASGQAVRNRYEFPLLAKSLEGQLTMRQLEFRYRPSPRCAQDPTPLSWHLTRVQRECVAEAWSDSQVLEARRQVADWLEDVH